MNARLKSILIAFFAGILSGTFVLGTGGRLLMRVIALASDVSAGFSLGGSLEVVALGAIIGSISGLGYPVLREILHDRTHISAVVFGLLVYAAMLILPIDGKQAANGFPDLQVFVYVTFGVLFILFGYAQGWFYTLIMKRATGTGAKK